MTHGIGTELQLPKPLPSNSFEGVRPLCFLDLAVDAGINVGGKEATCIVAFLPGEFQRRVGVGTERKLLLSSLKSILETPPEGAVRPAITKRPFSSPRLYGFPCGLSSFSAVSVSTSYPHDLSYPQKLPPKSSGCQSMTEDVMDRKMLAKRALEQASWTLVAVLGRRGRGYWRLGAESNRCTRLCRPLHHHSAT